MSRTTLGAPTENQESNKEEKKFPEEKTGNMDTFELHYFLWLPLVLSVKMLSIPIMKS